MNGVLRTQVGYAGGTKKNPAYHSLGDHTETIRIDYDPKKVSYTQLLDIFWANHDPAAQPWSKQYKSVIFYHNDEQKRLASETRTRLEEKIKRKVYTEIIPASEFYLAEDYHQKYYLRNAQELMQVFKEIYPADADFVSSTSAARINGYLGGYGKSSELEKELSGAGLHHETVKRILAVLN
jgi:methionine-S-sulfoxide reductase